MSANFVRLHSNIMDILCRNGVPVRPNCCNHFGIVGLWVAFQLYQAAPADVLRVVLPQVKRVVDRFFLLASQLSHHAGELWTLPETAASRLGRPAPDFVGLLRAFEGCFNTHNWSHEEFERRERVMEDWRNACEEAFNLSTAEKTCRYWLLRLGSYPGRLLSKLADDLNALSKVLATGHALVPQQPLDEWTHLSFGHMWLVEQDRLAYMVTVVPTDPNMPPLEDTLEIFPYLADLEEVARMEQEAVARMEEEEEEEEDSQRDLSTFDDVHRDEDGMTARDWEEIAREMDCWDMDLLRANYRDFAGGAWAIRPQQ